MKGFKILLSNILFFLRRSVTHDFERGQNQFWDFVGNSSDHIRELEGSVESLRKELKETQRKVEVYEKAARDYNNMRSKSRRLARGQRIRHDG